MATIQQIIDESRASIFRLEQVLDRISWNTAKNYEAFNDMLDGLNAALAELENGLSV